MPTDKRDDSDLDQLYQSLLDERNRSLTILEHETFPSPHHRRLAGHAFFSAERYKAAAAQYDLSLKASAFNTPETLLLAVYAHEQHAAKAMSIEEALDAIKRAENQLEVAKKTLNADKALASELKHCEGHVFLTSARSQLLFGRVFDWSHSTRGTKNLEAAAMDFRYNSCYTSAWSDLLQFDRTVALSKNSPDSLRAEIGAFNKLATNGDPAIVTASIDKMNVAFEVAFYYAYALSCLGRFPSATGLFREIIQSGKSLLQLSLVQQHSNFFLRSLQETVGHAQVFLAKNELRKEWLDYVPDGNSLVDIGKFLQNGKRMLRSRTAGPAAAETDSLLELVDFLRLVEQSVHSSQSIGGLSDDLKIKATGLLTSLGDRYLSALGNPGHRLITQVGDPEISCFPAKFRRHVSTLTVKEFLGTDPGQLGDIVILFLNEKDGADLAALRGKASEVYASRLIIAVYTWREAPTTGAAPYTAIAASQGQASSWILVSAAVALARRFLVNDRFAFNLAPCVASPAIKYQEPPWTLVETLTNA